MVEIGNAGVMESHESAEVDNAAAPGVWGLRIELGKEVEGAGHGIKAVVVGVSGGVG